MKWSTIRENYPEKWVLVEAIDATSVNSNRVIKKAMKIEMYNGLPTVSINLKYKLGSIQLEQVLIEQWKSHKNVWCRWTK
ncbi:hypothetical protein [Cohnella herbarum]|uniref:Uncharacterized protein n=1 Tax=Cohnella herbarum TaxID=2728023 RepID=A0A7Z2VGS9_9BACL|nr:hypothetical protein [Cohnella herbarum]QJD82916.1 hypothetical protein HH215_06805 [Cohnella herbarum]